MNFKTRVWLSSQTWIEKYKTYIYKKQKQWETTELGETWSYINIELN